MVGTESQAAGAAAPAPVVVVGYGSIGRRHLSVLREMLPDAPLWVLRRQPGKLAPEHGDVGVLTDLDQALALSPRAAVICSPAPLHAAQVARFLSAGVPVLIEKPLAAAMADADAVVTAWQGLAAGRTIAQVGYCLRYDPALQVVRRALLDGRIGRLAAIEAEVAQDLRDWRTGSDWRDGVSARRDLGGGVLLELSHEIDLVRWLMGEVISVSAQTAISGLLPGIEVEDWADLSLRGPDGVVARVHLDMVQRPARRLCRLTGERGTLEWDGIARSARLFDRTDGQWHVLPVPTVDRNHLFREQLRDFLNSVETGRPPLVGVADGRRVVEIALAAARSSAEGRRIDL